MPSDDGITVRSFLVKPGEILVVHFDPAPDPHGTFDEYKRIAEETRTPIILLPKGTEARALPIDDLRRMLDEAERELLRLQGLANSGRNHDQTDTPARDGLRD